MPNRNYPYTVTRPRPAGPLGYERGFQDSNTYYQYASPNPRAPSNYRPVHSFTEGPSNRQNFRRDERVNSQEYNLGTGMSALSIENGTSIRSPYLRTPNIGFMPNQQQPTGFLPNQQQSVQSPGPPPSLPPTNWIGRQPGIGYAAGFSKQEISSRAMHDLQQQQQANKMYRIKSRSSDSSSDAGK